MEYEDEDSPGTVRQLNMTDMEFRECIGLLMGFEADDAPQKAGQGGKDKKGSKKK